MVRLHPGRTLYRRVRLALLLGGFARLGRTRGSRGLAGGILEPGNLGGSGRRFELSGYQVVSWEVSNE